MVLLGYLPTTDLLCFSDKKRSAARWKLFHDSLRAMLKPLIEAGKNGVNMVCSDGLVRRVFPILAAYVADYPEQCLVSCCMKGRCPKCRVKAKKLGEYEVSAGRDPEYTLNVLRRKKELEEEGVRVNYSLFDDEGLRPIYEPFWADLPHCNIFQSFTPDLLHQLHKGVFKDHLVSWCTALVGEEELDDRFASMSAHPHLRHFKDGISTISQWTGAEHKELEKVFLGALANAEGVTTGVVKAVRAGLDFIYYAQLRSHSDKTLEAMEDALREFHEHKDAFVKAGVRKDFEIPKLHAMKHYVEMIKLLGSADGYNTELSERLHIDLAKDAYQASNKRAFLKQMILWLTRQESLYLFDAYWKWHCKGVEVRDEGGGPPEVLTAEDDEPIESEDHEDVVFNSGPNGSVSPYLLAKHPAYTNKNAMQIMEDHKAPDFLPALVSFLDKNVPGATKPNGLYQYSLYKRLTIMLPNSPQIDPLKRRDGIRATPALKSNKNSVDQFDTVLIKWRDRTHAGQSSPSIRAARLKAIFSLPPNIYHTPLRLAYVEMFRAFRAPDSATKLHSTSPSFLSNGAREVRVIPLEDIIQSCHLIPRFGREKDPRWDHRNVMEKAEEFYFNHYLSVHDFVTYRNSDTL